MSIQVFPQEEADGLAKAIASQSSVSYASVLEPANKILPTKKFKTLANINDEDLYGTQSILVTTNWNKNDDIFDKAEVWNARHSPEDKPTNLEHKEDIIVGHITANYPITDDGILIDENTPIENLPEKYHILTSSVIYKAFSSPELQERTSKLIAEIENNQKYVSMECFFKGFDYGLVNKVSGEYKILPRNESTAYLTKYLRAYGGLGEHDNYKVGRVLRNITFSGKGYVDKPANPESIIFTKNDFAFLEKNDDFANSGVNISQSDNEQMEINQMSVKAEDKSAEVVAALEAANLTVAELQTEIENLKTSHSESLASVTALKDQLESEKAELLAAKESSDATIAEYTSKLEVLQASVIDLEGKLETANTTIAAYVKKEKTLMRKAALVESGVEDIDDVLAKFDSLDDETFAAMTDMLKKNKDKTKKYENKASDADASKSDDLVAALDNVETTDEIVTTVGGEDNSEVESTRAALVNFVKSRLGKK
jgi:hypothetical protein